jgi:hypothetical protein
VLDSCQQFIRKIEEVEDVLRKVGIPFSEHLSWRISKRLGIPGVELLGIPMKYNSGDVS